MKRKEAIKFLDSVAEYISGVDGTITLFNPKSNESVELDTDLAFCFMGTPIVAMKDLLESDKLDETWCLYDGQLIDDELYMELGKFVTGVRISSNGATRTPSFASS